MDVLFSGMFPGFIARLREVASRADPEAYDPDNSQQIMSFVAEALQRGVEEMEAMPPWALRWSGEGLPQSPSIELMLKGTRGLLDLENRDAWGVLWSRGQLSARIPWGDYPRLYEKIRDLDDRTPASARLIAWLIAASLAGEIGDVTELADGRFIVEGVGVVSASPVEEEE